MLQYGQAVASHLSGCILWARMFSLRRQVGAKQAVMAAEACAVQFMWQPSWDTTGQRGRSTWTTDVMDQCFVLSATLRLILFVDDGPSGWNMRTVGQ